ncbi:rhomboid family intramembrane serine protease [Macrococcus animalis]|uniref:rhomboid family intramembrane serine protease n=1 Tax=Macrococcus animalis TaxID=3395467 RepID=UPI0039BE0874
MITDKLVWKSIYEYIKYSDYDFVTISEELDDVWLYSRSKKTLKRVILNKQTAQSTLFMVQKIMDHHDEIETMVEHNINHYEIILVNQEILLSDMPLNIKVISCLNAQSIKHTFNTPFKAISSKTKPQSVAWYQNRVIKQNPVDIAMTKFTPLTYLLIAINIISFIIMSLWHMTHKVDMIVEKGGLTHFNFVHGDYYRALTSMFLHFDFQHILFNMMSLYIMGKIVEYLYHKWQYLIIYLGGGIFGNLVSLAFDTTSISVGASGAICALMGAILAHILFSGKFEKKFIAQIFIGSIIYLAISSLFANVNNFAHFGGLFGGLFIAILIHLFNKKRQYFNWMSVGFIIIVVLLLVNIFSEKEHHIYNEFAATAIANGSDQDAKEILTTTMNKGYENDETYVYFGLLKTKQESLSNGITIWKKGLKEFPNSDKLNYQMALAMRALDDYDAANKYLNKAIEVNSTPDYLKLQKEFKEFR